MGWECFIIVLVLWVFSVCLHEFGHAAVAYLGGDHTVKEKGYLTLNPVHYTHPILSIALPVLFLLMGGIGLPGGAVYIERQLLRSRAWDTWVSLAGPAMHLPLIVLIGLAFKTGLLQNDPQHLGSVAMALLLQLQICAVLLNMLPVPPLDGFQALAPWLPSDVREKMYGFSNMGMLLVFLALWYVEPLNEAFWDAAQGISGLFGVHPYMFYAGWEAFKFWER